MRDMSAKQMWQSTYWEGWPEALLRYNCDDRQSALVLIWYIRGTLNKLGLTP